MRAAAPLEIIGGHLRHGEAGRDGEAQDALAGIAACDRPGHADQAGFRCRIMPVLGRIAAKGGAAGDINDASRDAEVEEMRHGELAEVRRGLEVDAHRPGPGQMPFLVGRVVGHGFVDAGIVDQHVDLAVELGQRRVPDVARRGRVGEVAGDELVTAHGRMTNDAVVTRLQ